MTLDQIRGGRLYLRMVEMGCPSSLAVQIVCRSQDTNQLSELESALNLRAAAKETM